MAESKDAMIEKDLPSIIEKIWDKATKDNYVSHTMISRIAFEHARLFSLTMALDYKDGKKPDYHLYKIFKNSFIKFTKRTFTPDQILKEYTHITETSEDYDYKKVSKHLEDLSRELNRLIVLEASVEDSLDLDS